jgi:hypothetical protein
MLAHGGVSCAKRKLKNASSGIYKMNKFTTGYEKKGNNKLRKIKGCGLF